jgi:transcriptional regulator with XRE-family HTH domain
MSLDIKDLRKKKGLNQTDLAKALHVSVKTITNWEKGNVTIPETKMVMLRDFFEEKGKGTDSGTVSSKANDFTDLISPLIAHKVSGAEIPGETVDQIIDTINKVSKLEAERAALYKALRRE